MHKHNKFLILLICVSLAFLVSCMDGKEQTETTDPKTEGVLTQSPVTEAPATSAFLTTAPQEAEKLVSYTDKFYYDLMYETDEDGNWDGIGGYIINYESLGAVDDLLLSRSQEAYNEVKSALNGETEKTVTEICGDFLEDIRTILQNNEVEYVEVELGSDRFKFLELKQNTGAPVTTSTKPAVTTALPLPQTRTEQVTSAPVTIAPVTTTEHKEEPSKPSDKYDEGILKDILYTADEDGNWTGLGKYITNPELLGDVEHKVILRSKMAYDEVNSILNGEDSERTLTDVYKSFKAKVKSSLLEGGIEYTEIDAVGYEIIRLK